LRRATATAYRWQRQSRNLWITLRRSFILKLLKGKTEVALGFERNDAGLKKPSSFV
jgi:hypothetical protein